MDDFNYLLDHGNIGFYNRCEIIEIFGFNQTTKQVFNIFTLIVFEDSQQHESNEFITSELKPFRGTKEFKWGIKRRITHLETAKAIFNQLKKQ